MMQPVHGGATASPFNTHHNAVDMDLFLRIAPELYLDALCRQWNVYEINRNFRKSRASQLASNPNSPCSSSIRPTLIIVISSR